MSRIEKNPEREERIVMEIVVDTYGPEEQAMGWCCYLQDHLEFPFTAQCIEKKRSSPLKVGQTVEVKRMAPEDECEWDMLVEIEWDDDFLAVPLSQLDAPDVDDVTREAIADWRYWVEQGYRFG